jgi:hypothetical protein
MKIASITQMKNESSILPFSISRLEQLVDFAVIIDDHSEDNSIDIVKNSQMYKDGRIILLKNEDNDRKEGREFNKCFNEAIRLGATRIYISDCDEIVADGNNFETLKSVLRNDNKNIRVKRAEIAIDQNSIYGINGGTGKLVVANTKNIIGFDLNSTIHCSQPPIIGETVLLSENDCVLLHYGPCCIYSQIAKCLSYIVWENISINKPFSQGFNEYFKIYENFVMHGEYSLIGKFICEEFLLKSIPYKKWLPKELSDFCDKYKHLGIDNNTEITDFEINRLIKGFCELEYVKENICARAR